MAIAAGAAETVVYYRSLGGSAPVIRHSASSASGQPRAVSGQGGFRPDFTEPFGVFIPVQFYALQFKRHMIDYGTTTEQLGALVVTQNRNAQRNPNAITYGRPISLEDHATARPIAEPYRLYDCTQFLDGAGAVIVTGAERARSLKQPPVYLMGAAEGSGRGDHMYNQVRHQARFNTAGFEEVARDLFTRAGIGPQDVDVAQIFQTFSGQTLLALEDFGFCRRGESGPFVASGAIDYDGGSLPINTHGGDLSEGYLHGFGNLLEGVRQMRGTATSQVADAATVLVTSGPSAMPSSALILRR
jgi:acetyl-CoA acetyltransferase